MIQEGEIFVLRYGSGSEDHALIALTKWEHEGEIVTVPLTDCRNLLLPSIEIPAETSLSGQFKTRIRSTVHFAYAKRRPTDLLRIDIANGLVHSFGICDEQWLAKIRLALFESEHTPPEVVTFCQDLDWGY